MKQPRHRFRGWLIASFSLVILAGLIWFLLFSPVFRLEYIEVEGNHFISLGTIELALTEYTSSAIWKVLPRSGYFVFSDDRARTALMSRLQQEQAVETLTVEKVFPATIRVSVTERVPNLVYVNGGHRFLLDRSGIITAEASDEAETEGFPVLFDQTTRLLTIGERGASQQQVDFLFAVQKELTEKTDIPVDFFYLPPVECLTVERPAEPVEELPEESTNGNVNEAATNDNSNSSEEGNENSNENTNQSAEEQPPKKPPEPLIGSDQCHPETLALQQKEVSVRSTEDWEIYFRIDDSAADQVVRLVRVIREKKLDRAALDYVDLRFGEQVVYR